MIKFRDLTAEDIECRVQSVKQNGLILLLYKNARVDMAILDETVGAENWMREHYEQKGNLFCRVSININYKSDSEYPHYVHKDDCGSESNTEPEKGEASDSFKRACVNWGIGRELYTAPFIFIPADKCNITSGKCYDRFAVDGITIKDKRIVALTIKNTSKRGEICFTWHDGAANTPAAITSSPQRRKADLAPKLVCIRCKKEIKGFKSSKGTFTAEQWAEMSRNKYEGNVYCLACAKQIVIPTTPNVPDPSIDGLTPPPEGVTA